MPGRELGTHQNQTAEKYMLRAEFSNQISPAFSTHLTLK